MSGQALTLTHNSSVGFDVPPTLKFGDPYQTPMNTEYRRIRSVAKRRQRIAMGASPWEMTSPALISRVAATEVCGRCVFQFSAAAPRLTSFTGSRFPRVCTRGYALSPLRGFGKTEISGLVLRASRCRDFQLFRALRCRDFQLFFDFS